MKRERHSLPGGIVLFKKGRFQKLSKLESTPLLPPPLVRVVACENAIWDFLGAILNGVV